MAFVKIQIAACEAGQSDYVVTLVEEGGQATQAVLPEAKVINGPWHADKILGRVTEAGAGARDHPDFAAIAQTLYDWLLPAGPVRQRWVDLNRVFPLPRLCVEILVDTLVRLPWEMVSNAPPRPLRPALVNGLYRLRTMQPVACQSSPWPFRILIVVGCAEAESGPLGVAQEVTEIERTFLPLGRSVDVHCIHRPDKNTLKCWVQKFQPHVLHFAGHAGKLPGPAGKIGLCFDLGSTPWVWSGSDLDTDLLAWGWTPKFVFLNACRSSEEQEGSWSVQHSFLDGGAQAVLGMQADVRGDRAGKFAATLYQQCSLGKTLEEAALVARQSLAACLPSYDHIDWALPALATTGHNVKLFEPQGGPGTPEFENCREFEEARYFANCRESRRELTFWVYPAVQGPASKNILVVTGEPKSGKSHLLKWCMETWALSGARVRYIELHGHSKTLLDVLRQIRKGETDGKIENDYLHEELPPAVFKQFKWELNNLIQTGEIGEWVEADHIGEPEGMDDAGTLPARGDKRPEPLVCARFLRALRSTAELRPLILVIDKLGGQNNERLLLQDDFEQLIRHLFRPIAEDPVSRIKLAFSASGPEAADYKLALLPAQHTVSLQIPIQFDDAQLAQLASEMFWFQDASEIEDFARKLFSFPRSGTTAQGLARLQFVLQALKGSDILNQVRRMR